jgi:L-methionine (R)-S-oxide reductase
MEQSYDVTVDDVRQVMQAPDSAAERLGLAMRLINTRHGKFEWVGVYVLHDEVLVLGPYVGKPTDHTRIPVGKGVCGTAVADRADQVIDDVTVLDNYLACNNSVRSEIVVLVWGDAHDDSEIIGQIDADCDEVGAFGADEEAFLHQVAALIAPAVAEMRQA